MNTFKGNASNHSNDVFTREIIAEKGSVVTLGEPSDYPHEMVKAMRGYFNTDKRVKAAYLKLMHMNGEFSWLIAVDFIGVKNEIFSAAARVGEPYSMGRYMDFVSLNSDLGVNAAQGSKPFYKRKKFGLF